MILKPLKHYIILTLTLVEHLIIQIESLTSVDILCITRTQVISPIQHFPFPQTCQSLCWQDENPPKCYTSHIHCGPNSALQPPNIRLSSQHTLQTLLSSRYTKYSTLLLTLNIDIQCVRWLKMPWNTTSPLGITLPAPSNHYQYDKPPVNTPNYTFSQDMPTTLHLPVPWTWTISA